MKRIHRTLGFIVIFLGVVFSPTGTYAQLLPTVYDFWLKNDGKNIYADQYSDWQQHPNFDAQYKIKNDHSQTITIEKLALAVHNKSSGEWYCDLADPRTGQPRFYDNKSLAPGATFWFNFSVGAIKDSGSYKVVAKARMGGYWYHLRELDLVVQPSSFTEPTVLSFQVSSTSLVADPNSSKANPNFDAQYSIKNPDLWSIKIDKLALAVHDANNDFLRDVQDPATGRDRFYDSIILYPGNTHQFELSTTYFNEPGTFKVVAKAYMNNQWRELVVKNILVQEPADTIKPTGSISGIQSSYNIGDTISFTVNGSDNKNLKSLYFAVYDASNSRKDYRNWSVSGLSTSQSGTFSTSGWSEGTYHGTLRVTDAANNYNEYTAYFTVSAVTTPDTIKPTGSISGIQASYKVGDVISFSVTGEDDTKLANLDFEVANASGVVIDSTKHTWDASGKTSFSGSGQFATSGWSSGTYYYALWVNDASGNNEDYTGSFTLTLDQNYSGLKLIRTSNGRPINYPVIWKVETDGALQDGTLFTLHLKNLRDGKGDGGVNGELTEIPDQKLTNGTIEHTFIRAGIYEVSVEAPDGTSTEETPILQIIEPAPIPEFDTNFEQNVATGCKQDTLYDVIVVDGTSAGIGAAITAAREGLSTCLLESTDLLGGMFTNGIGKTDIGLAGFGDLDLRLSYGIFDELREGVKGVPGYDDAFGKEGMKYRPSQIRQALYNLVIQAMKTGKLDIQLNIPFEKIAGGGGSDFRINDKYQAKYLIDATESGDVAAALGADYEVSRPMQAYSYVMTITRYADKGANWSFMQEKPSSCDSECGSGTDCYTESLYDWQHSWTFGSGQLASNVFQVKHQKPNGYWDWNGSRYWKLGYELIDGNEIWGSAETNYAEKPNDHERAANRERYINHALCFLFHMQKAEQEQGNGGDGKNRESSGLTETEDPSRGNFPASLYVREGRRIKGLSTFESQDSCKAWEKLQSDIRNKIRGCTISGCEAYWGNILKSFTTDFQGKCALKSTDRPIQDFQKTREGIGVVTYSMDRHDKTLMKECPETGDGARIKCTQLNPVTYAGIDYFVDYTGPGVIPLGIMIPVQKGTNTAISNIMVPLAVSSTERGFNGSLRMEPTRMNMGQAAALAISVARDRGIELSNLVDGNNTEGRKALFAMQKELIQPKAQGGYGGRIFLYKDDELGPHSSGYIGNIDVAVQFMGIWGIANGEYEFRPGEPINRAEFMKMVVIAARLALNGCIEDTYKCKLQPLGSPRYIPGVTFMNDAFYKEGDWYAKYVEEAYNAGIIQGYTKDDKPTGIFGKTDPVERAAAAKIVLEAFGLKTGADGNVPDVNYPDVPKGEWYSRYVAWASQEENGKIMTGYQDGRFELSKHLTRGEAALVLYRAIIHTLGL